MTGKDLSTTGPTTTNGLVRQCVAHRKNGERCRRAPIKGGTVCDKHGGKAPQVRAAAQQRLLMAADGLMANLLKIATSGESEANRLRATMDALNRAGLSERQGVDIAVTSPFDVALAEIMDAAVREVPEGYRLPGRGGGAPEQPFDDSDEDGRNPDDEDYADEPAPRRPETIVVPPPDDDVQVITTLPASRPKPPAYMKRLRGDSGSGWGDFS